MKPTLQKFNIASSFSIVFKNRKKWCCTMRRSVNANRKVQSFRQLLRFQQVENGYKLSLKSKHCKEARLNPKIKPSLWLRTVKRLWTHHSSYSFSGSSKDTTKQCCYAFKSFTHIGTSHYTIY